MIDKLTKDSIGFISGLFPERSDEGHKGSFGTLLVVGGSKYMTGALNLTVSSALRSGVGMVRAFAPEDALMPVRINCPCALTSSFEEEDNLLRKAGELMNSSSAVVIGPGLDINDKRSMRLLEFFVTGAKNLVIDASALNLLSKSGSPDMLGLGKRESLGLNRAVLTPHVGEFKRFDVPVINYNDFDNDGLYETCKIFSKKTDSVLVLKNHNTLVTTPDGKCYYNYGDNSGMAKGGSGDVLAGLIGGFLALGMEPEHAAIAGVFVHSRAGKKAASNLTKLHMLPTDIIDMFPLVYKELGW